MAAPGQNGGDDDRGRAVSPFKTEKVNSCHAESRSYETKQSCAVFEQHGKHRWIFRLAQGGENAKRPLLILRHAERAKGYPPRYTFKHEGKAEHDIVDIRVFERVGMQQLIDSLVKGNSRTDGKDQNGDDKRPEENLRPITEWMRTIRGSLGATHTEQQ